MINILDSKKRFGEFVRGFSTKPRSVMNMIDGINLAGIMAVLGFPWKFSSELNYNIKLLSERVVQL